MWGFSVLMIGAAGNAKMQVPSVAESLAELQVTQRASVLVGGEASSWASHQCWGSYPGTAMGVMDGISAVSQRCSRTAHLSGCLTAPCQAWAGNHEALCLPRVALLYSMCKC